MFQILFFSAMRSALFLLFAAGHHAAFTQSDQGWVFKNEKDAIKVYSRYTNGVQEIKLTASLKAPLSGFVLLFSEIENYPEWGYKVMESRLVRRVSHTEFFYYSRLDLPWPMSDRDIVMHTVWSQDPATRIVTGISTAMPNEIPEVKDVVRVRDTHTRWTLTPGPAGWLHAEYYIYSKPDGNMPDWLVNMTIETGPRETFKNIRNFLQRPKYQAAKLAYIKD